MDWTVLQPVYRRQKAVWVWASICFLILLTAWPALGERARRNPAPTQPNVEGMADFITGDNLSAKGAAARPAARAAQPVSKSSGVDPEGRSITSADAASVLASAFESRAREILERYLPAREFQVTAIITPTRKNIPLTPYDPSGLVLGRSPEELAQYLQRVDIEVLLTTRLQSTRQRLQTLLFKELNLSNRRGDRIRFGSLGIEIESDAWTKEKTDLKSELSRLKQESDRLSRDLARAQQQEGFLGKYTLWAVVGFIVAVFGTILTALYLAGRSLSTAGKNLSTAFTTIASAVENVGGSIQAAAGLQPAGGDAPKVLEGKLISDGGNKGSGLASLPMESLNAHFMKLRQELVESLNETTEAVIIRQLTHLLSNPATVGRAVVTLELLGRDVATEMFKRLGLNSQEALLKFMREGGYEKPKVEMMLEAGEELKTKLLVDSLDMARGRPSEKVGEKVLQLTDEDLSNLANEMPPELLPRLFLYLDAPKIAMVLGSLKSSNPKSYQKILTLLSKMPEAERSANQDIDITRTIDIALNKTKSDAQRPFLKVYKEIIEAAEDDLSEDIVRELSADPRLDLYFRENIITIRTFFKLTDEARNEIVETLSNKDVAALAFGVKDDDRRQIMQSLPGRRKGMIAEEFESLSSRGGRQAQYAFKRVRDIIVKKLTDMKNNSMLAPVLRKEGEKAKGGGGGGTGSGTFARSESTNAGTATALQKLGAPAPGSTPKTNPGLKPLTPDGAKKPGGPPVGAPAPKIPPGKKTG